MDIKFNINLLNVLIITPFLASGLLCFVTLISTYIPKLYKNKEFMNSLLTIVAGSISVELFIILISFVVNFR